MQSKEDIKNRDLRREYKRFIGEKKLNYYLTRFERMEDNHTKISFNLCGFLFNIFWCFYRKMFVPGALLLAYGFAVMYIQIRFFTNVSVAISAIFMLLNFAPSIICGFWGNNLYSNYVHGCIARAIDMPHLQKEKYYKENGDTSARITVGIVIAYIVFSLALLFSYSGNFIA